MSLANKAAEEIKLLAKRFKPLFEAAEALEKLGSWENAAVEAEQRKNQFYKDAEAAKNLVIIEESKLLKAKADIAKAENDALLVIEKVNVKAENILKEANLNSNKAINEARSKVKDALDEKNLYKTISDNLFLEIDAKKKELEEIKNKIVELKNKISNFIK